MNFFICCFFMFITAIILGIMVALEPKNIEINKEIISKLNPCKDRFDNYVKQYGDKTFTKQQFMGLKNITHSDKVWVAFRLLDSRSSRLAAAKISRSVLRIYEETYPNDLRPRKAIEVSEAYALGKISKEELKEAEIAAWSAWSAEDVTVKSAAMFAARSAADAARSAVIHSGSDKPIEKIIHKILMKYWK